MQSINPTSGERIANYPELPAGEVGTIISEAHGCWREWRKASFPERAGFMLKSAGILRERKHELAKLMALEMGKPVQQGVAEAEKCALACEYYAGNAVKHLAPDEIKTEASRSYAAFEPLGVVLAIMPWNFPLWQVYRFAAPALMAGNVGVLKHASNVQGCARAIEEMFADAGFPRGCFRNMAIGSKRVGEVIENPLVQAVTLTGSTPAGKSVASQAGAVLKKTVLELGGSDAYLVLEDADLEQAAKICVTARLVNSGQSCIAAKRFIVAKPVLKEFTERFVEMMKVKRVGDPLDEESDLGPQARVDLRDALHEQVRRSVEAGAKLLLGGGIPEGPGAFYPPTVLAGVRPGMAAFDEETFGPVAAIISAADDKEAVALANQSVFGLGGAVFTRNLERGERVARELEAGAAFVNQFVASDPRLPFGGIKESGYGRELGSYGIKEFVNIKTVYIKEAVPNTSPPKQAE